MPEQTRRWTREMVLALPDDRNRYELIGGELVVTPAPTPTHQLLVTSLAMRLSRYLDETGVARLLFSPADITLGEEEILQPDLFVFPVPANGFLKEWQEITSLLLAVEVLSPSTARYDRGLKRRRYQRAGVQQYWIVDPDARVVERWGSEDSRPEILDATLEWRPFPNLDPLVIELAALFDECLGRP